MIDVAEGVGGKVGEKGEEEEVKKGEFLNFL